MRFHLMVDWVLQALMMIEAELKVLEHIRPPPEGGYSPHDKECGGGACRVYPLAFEYVRLAPNAQPFI